MIETKRLIHATQVDFYPGFPFEAPFLIVEREGVGGPVHVCLEPQAAAELRDQLSTYRTKEEADEEYKIFSTIRKDALARHGA